MVAAGRGILTRPAVNYVKFVLKPRNIVICIMAGHKFECGASILTHFIG